MSDTNPPVQDEGERLIEKLAAIEHERWADWQTYCHKVIRQNKHDIETTLSWWDRQIATPYADLSEAEKQSDRDQVMRYWPLLQEAITRHTLAVLEEAKADFIRVFTNDHDPTKPPRWLRGVAVSEQDLLDQILEWFDEAIKQRYEDKETK